VVPQVEEPLPLIFQKDGAPRRCSLAVREFLNKSSRHQIACFKATEGFDPPPYRAALSQKYSVASIATLPVPRCLHSPVLCCSFCNVVLFFCDLEACDFVMATINISRALDWMGQVSPMASTNNWHHPFGLLPLGLREGPSVPGAYTGH
jgi:hypothetical protein